MTALAYLDASAIVKLVVEEPESQALNRWYVEAERLITSRVGVIETLRASARAAVDPNHRDKIIADLEVVELSPAISKVATTVGPEAMRTFDAIHLATALAIGGSLDAFVTYDQRLATAARALGLLVVQPA